jgi:serine/threonine-protein kinase
MRAPTASDVEQLLEGTPYRVVSSLASGGMGEIYEAVGPGESERVVVKLLKAHLVDQADMVDRMRLEGEALELLRHPSIVAYRGRGVTAAGRPYVAMERLEGATLQKELRRRGAFPVAEAIHCVRRLLSALHAVHGAGIVHRDVKPENVMFLRRGSAAPEIKLLDFGVAKVTSGPGREIAPLAFPTMDGQCVGTPRYAAPEQALGAAVDRRTDIYAAGLLLYMLVAGRGPFDDIRGAGNILLAHIREEPPPPSHFTRCPLPLALESVILRAIAKNPSDRFADALSFSRELLVTVGKMCVPLDFVASPADIARALTEPRARITAVARVKGSTSTSVPSAAVTATFGEAATVRAQTTRVDRGRARRARAPRLPVSVREVLLSAAAFAAVAGGVAMWFVH